MAVEVHRGDVEVVAAGRHHAPDLVFAVLRWRARRALRHIIFPDEGADGPNGARQRDDVARAVILLEVESVYFWK